MRAKRSLFDIELKLVRYAGISGGLRRHYQPPSLRAFWEILSAQSPRLAKAGTFVHSQTLISWSKNTFELLIGQF